MLKTLGIVQLHGGAEQSAFGRRLHGKPLVEWVVRRVTDSSLLDGVIVAAADTPGDRAAAEQVPLDVPVFFGDPTDPLRRFRDAALEYNADSIVRVGTHNPFIDPALIDRLISTAAAEPELDYVGYSSRDGRPAAASPLGVFAEWLTTRTLRRIDRRATDPAERQAVTTYIFSHPDEFRATLIPVPMQLDRDDVRLSVDSQEDWEHAQEILEAIGPEHMDWQRIAGLLYHQPAMRERMAVLNREAGRI